MLHSIRVRLKNGTQIKRIERILTDTSYVNPKSVQFVFWL